MKYIAVKMYLHGCPACDSTSFSSLEMFQDLDSLVEFAIANIGTYEIQDIYCLEDNDDVSGGQTLYESAATFNYNTSSHSYSEIQFKNSGQVRKWKRHEYEKGKWQEYEN